MALTSSVPASQWDNTEPTEMRLRAIEAELSEIQSRLYSISSANRKGLLNPAGDVFLNANGFNVINKNGVTVGTWQSDGDIFFGTNINDVPTGVTIAIFNAAQTYNGESMGVGDMLFGDNSVNKASMLWDASAGILYFRGGSPRTNQVYINTTGELYAGGGKVRLNADGLEVRNNSGTKYVRLYNSAVTGYASLVAYMNLDANDPGGGTTGTAVFGAEWNANNQSDVYCWLNEVDLVVKKAGGWRYLVQANYDYVNFNPPIRVTDQGANPANPPDNSMVNIYQKGTKLILQFNDSGTTRWKYLEMTGTGVTWQHTTTAP